MKPAWITRGVVGIVLATFFSDVGHEMVTVMLPGYLAANGLGAAALGMVEGIADLVSSLSKLTGGVIGHHTERRRLWATLGYVVTAVGTGAIGLVRSAWSIATLRCFAWVGRGVRGPLRDHMLADEVDPSQFGRAYGVERSADMFGAVTGSLLAIVLFSSGVPVATVILVSLIPSLLSAVSFGTLTHDRHRDAGDGKPRDGSRKLPARYWRVLAGVFVFGLGDFSRTFLIILAAGAFGEHAAPKSAMSIAMLLYVAHNVVSGVVALPVGRLADHRPKISILLAGFLLGAATNAMLAFGVDSTAIVVTAIAVSGVYIAIQETVEKAVVAELLPREVRSLGLGVLAATNAVGDVVSSLYVGFMLDAGHPLAAFGAPAVAGIVAAIWLAIVGRR